MPRFFIAINKRFLPHFRSVRPEFRGAGGGEKNIGRGLCGNSPFTKPVLLSQWRRKMLQDRGEGDQGSRIPRLSRISLYFEARFFTRSSMKNKKHSFFFFQVYRWHVQYQSGFYFKRTFHALPSRPVFLIRSREDPTSLSLSRSFRIKQEKLSNRRLTTNKIISTLVQGEERERRKERKKEGRETKGTNDLQTQKDHESLALSRTLEIHPRGLHNHIF